MAVIISNISGENYGKGVQKYRLDINKNSILTFTSEFDAGLGECLRQAAVAFEAYELEKMEKLLRGYEDA